MRVRLKVRSILLKETGRNNAFLRLSGGKQARGSAARERILVSHGCNRNKNNCRKVGSRINKKSATKANTASPQLSSRLEEALKHGAGAKDECTRATGGTSNEWEETQHTPACKHAFPHKTSKASGELQNLKPCRRQPIISPCTVNLCRTQNRYHVPKTYIQLPEI